EVVTGVAAGRRRGKRKFVVWGARIVAATALAFAFAGRRRPDAANEQALAWPPRPAAVAMPSSGPATIEAAPTRAEPAAAAKAEPAAAKPGPAKPPPPAARPAPAKAEPAATQAAPVAATTRPEPTPQAEARREPAETRDSPKVAPAAKAYADLVRSARRVRRARPDEALALLDRALAENPSGSEALVLKAETLLDKGEMAQALAVCNQALAADDGNADAWRTKGKILLVSDTAGAKNALQKYLELRPDARDADDIRAALDTL